MGGGRIWGGGVGKGMGGVRGMGNGKPERGGEERGEWEVDVAGTGEKKKRGCVSGLQASDS